MKVSFKKLWVLCAEKEMSKAELRKRAGLSSATFKMDEYLKSFAQNSIYYVPYFEIENLLLTNDIL